MFAFCMRRVQLSLFLHSAAVILLLHTVVEVAEVPASDFAGMV